MSDTPRTDAMVAQFPAHCNFDDLLREYRRALAQARELERELKAKTDELAHLQSAVALIGQSWRGT